MTVQTMTRESGNITKPFECQCGFGSVVAEVTEAGMGTLKQTVELPASPSEVWTVLMDSDLRTAAIGQHVQLDARVGGSIHVDAGKYGGDFGTFTELEPGRRIVQTWRCELWPDSQPDSLVEMTLEPSEIGTMVHLVHANLPEGDLQPYAQAWHFFYWGSMRAYFS